MKLIYNSILSSSAKHRSLFDDYRVSNSKRVHIEPQIECELYVTDIVQMGFSCRPVLSAVAVAIAFQLLVMMSLAGWCIYIHTYMYIHTLFGVFSAVAFLKESLTFSSARSSII